MCKQVQRDFIVKKLHRMRVTRDIWNGVFRISLHMTLDDPQRGEGPKTDNSLVLWTCRPLERLTNAK